MVNLDKSRIRKIEIYNGELYTLVAYSKSLKLMVRLVIWYSKVGQNSKLYFSTDPDMSGKDVIEYYRTRFQIEFYFRDAKFLRDLCSLRQEMPGNFPLTSMHLYHQ